jgi:hypothetical protein
MSVLVPHTSILQQNKRDQVPLNARERESLTKGCGPVRTSNRGRSLERSSNQQRSEGCKGFDLVASHNTRQTARAYAVCDEK